MAAATMSSSANKSPPRHRRRVVTYGKAKQFTAQTFSDEFDNQPAMTAKSTLNTSSEARKSQERSIAPLFSGVAMSSPSAPAQDDLFDVPSSGDERNEKTIPPAKKLPAFTPNRKVAAPAPAKTKQAPQLQPRAHQRQHSNTDAHAELSRKRKRGGLNAKMRDAIAQAPDRGTVVVTDSDSDGETATSRGSSASHTKRVLLPAADIGKIPAKKALSPAARAAPLRGISSLSNTRLSPGGARRSGENTRSPSPKKLSASHNIRSPRYKGSSAEPANPVTPRSLASRSGTPGSDGRGLTTPRQAQLWDQLLSGGELDATTKKINFDRLNLQTNEDRPRTEIAKRLPRRKLIDTLIPSANEASSSSPSSDEEEDVVMGDTLSGSENGQAPSSSQTTILSSQPTQKSSQQQQFSHGNLKNTYAGQRSYLEEPAMTLDQLLAQPLDVDEIQPIRKEQSRNKDEFDFLDDASDEERSAIKSIHELRARGGTRRLEDDISTLCEELEDHTKGSLSNRRSAVLDLFKKLTDPSFRSVFLQNSYEARVLSRCAQETDMVLGASIAACLIQILDTMTDLRPAPSIFQTGVCKVLTNILDFPQDLALVARDRKSNMSKVGQLAVVEFKAELLTFSAWKDFPDISIITPRLLAIKALELLTRRLKEAGADHRTLEFDLLVKYLDILETFFLHPSHEARPMSDHSDIIPLQLELILSMLESSATDPRCCSDTTLWTSSNLHRLVYVMDCAIAYSAPNSTRIHNLTVRLCISLANNNPRTCDLFAQQSFISRLASLVTASFAAQQSKSPGLAHSAINKTTSTNIEASVPIEDQGNLDNLLLSLGALINLAEYSDTVRLCLISPAPAGSSRAHDHLEHFLRIFKSLREERRRILAAPPTATLLDETSGGGSDPQTSVQASVNVAGSYLAVLLGNLCQNDIIRARVRASFPSSSSTSGREKGSLKEVIDAVEEFIAYNLEVDAANTSTSGTGSSGAGGAVDSRGGEGEAVAVDEAWVAFTRRLQSVAESLKSFS